MQTVMSIMAYSNICISFTDPSHNQSRKKNSKGSANSTSSTISTEAVLQVVEKLKLQRNRCSTRQSYYSTWKQFNEFFIKLDQKSNNWEDRLILFVGYLVESKKKSSMIRSYVLAIKSVLMEDRVQINENKYLLASLTKACKYQNDRVRTRLPILKGLLNFILREASIYFGDQPYLACLYRALFASAYYGLLRVGELTSDDHPVLAKDIHIGMNKKKFLFILRTSKTHWKDRKPQLV